MPDCRGSSQAKALTCTTSSGGENPGATRAGEFLQPAESFVKEALAPLADDLAAGIQTGGNFIVGDAFGGQENHLGAKDLKVWQRILCGASIQLLLFIRAEHDPERAFSWHIIGGLTTDPGYATDTGKTPDKYVIVFTKSPTNSISLSR